MSLVEKIILYYLVVINVFELVLMCVDKSRAKHDAWRISENTLMGVAIIGGSVGGIIGMRFCNHKINKAKFALGMPAILLLHIGIGYLLIRFVL